MSAPGPLTGLRVVDFSRLGPGPFASLILSDFGADVVGIARPGDRDGETSLGRTTIEIDLREAAGRSVAFQMAASADVVVEGFRPRVMERLGLGPEGLLAANPRLIYARMTGWGQSGPYAARAGHDINYLAISGALDVTGEDKPVAPPGLLGDLASGSYPMVIGIMMALFERERTGVGQVVDAAIVDGAAYLMTCLFAEINRGAWTGTRGSSLISGTAPFYGAYQCKDDLWFSVGAIEPKFYAAFLDILGLSDVSRDAAAQMERAEWPALRKRVARRFRTKSRDAWTMLFAERDACGAPVLTINELNRDPHMAARGSVTISAEGLRGAPAPRLSRHPDMVQQDRGGGEDPPLEALLEAYGVAAPQIAAGIASQAVRAWHPGI